jgi:hypothetical protein
MGIMSPGSNGLEGLAPCIHEIREDLAH